MPGEKSDKRGNGNQEKPSKRMQFMKALLTYAAAVLLGIVSIRLMRLHTSTKIPSELVQNQSNNCPEPPKYWGVCLWNWNTHTKNLRTVDRVFERLGYAPVNGSEGEDWDVLWTIEYPNRANAIFDPFFKPLKMHQRVNHFLGINYITAKSFMTTRNRDIKYILPGFVFPAMIGEFRNYVMQNPKARFVEKSVDNRGIRLVEEHEIKYDQSQKFYQRFMERPFLVDGRFMDFAVFVVVSSIDPLRVYRFEQEVYLRFCPEPYYPFDPKIRDKYVISDSRHVFFQLPKTKFYSDDYGYSLKLSIEDYFRKHGHNVTELWRKIDDAISRLVLNNEQNLMRETFKVFNSSHHFFELVRFDFILNEDLEPHITEVNMSPGIAPQSQLGERLASTFEQVVYDTLKLVGAGSKLDLMARYDSMSSQMTSNSKNIAVNVAACIDNNCHQNCYKAECKLCTPCLDTANINAMHRAYREHVRRGGFKRIFPSTVHFNEDYISRMTPRNQISIKWFKAKCEENLAWC